MAEESRLENTTESDEGYKKDAYRDTNSYWTLGIGHCLETNPLTGPQWKYLLDNKLIAVSITHEGARWMMDQEYAALKLHLARDYSDFWPLLNDARQDALLEMAYQLGVDKEEAFHDMVGAIRKAVTSGLPSDWAIVEQNGLDSKWAREDSPARATRVMDQLRTGLFP